MVGFRSRSTFNRTFAILPPRQTVSLDGLIEGFGPDLPKYQSERPAQCGQERTWLWKS